ncbi:aminomethyltransferase [Natronoarchaeum philippinense]|uniref:Probable aminomethyltransferase n=1 Tax=Natronoarchaeum philippinense TaxID=558529 RepID=A0A285N8B2_NATPI|nr:glycine cleavage system aminomethyltransferase GcvT [Natronoarchaeum philippinense]SNZ05659.1 aminomethyltransferase [Natronoarchaeum philippinense]
MSLRQPPLAAVHEDAGAKTTEFGGWEMPVEFDSIRTEHRAVRESAGIFDVSHMSEIEVRGPDAEALLQRLTTNDVTALSPGDSQYSMITDDEGVILDDTVVYRLPSETPEYLFVPNAGHDEQMLDRWTDHRDEWGLDATVENRTGEYAMFAVQGPEAPDLAAGAADERVDDIARFEADHRSVAGVDCLLSRTGYTGEAGFEVLAPWDEAKAVWNAFECQPCGLGARDTLRTEAGFLLSGQDFDPAENPRNPYEAGVGFAVKLDTEFVGRDALERAHEEGVDQKFVGVRLIDRGVPRNGYAVTTPQGDRIGTVTSGTMSPTLDEPIGLGYVDAEHADHGTTVRVEVRDQAKKARVESPNFLDR